MRVIQHIGRILYALPFGVFGVLHFVNAPLLSFYSPVIWPSKSFWVYFMGVAMILAALAILANRLVAIACLGLAGVLLTYIISLHIPYFDVTNSAIYGANALLKDTALMGAAIFIGATKWLEDKGYRA